ncbi:hypothetical protein [Leifsonia poae]|uniref:hypothetical protein n=1 Tax=Leifsonia poae TaxID=110933 RepID=UPI001CBC984C|nr:hypothetical protein [Leifsonia poae]
MTARRLPRGTRVKPVSVGWKIEQTSKDKMDAVAAAMGVSAAVLLEEMIDRLDLDEHGVPTWWTPDNSEELPINTG